MYPYDHNVAAGDHFHGVERQLAVGEKAAEDADRLVPAIAALTRMHAFPDHLLVE